MNLKSNAIIGVKWISLARLLKQLLQILTLIILARLLSPKDFGLMALAMVVIGFLNILNDLGVSAALIQKRRIGKHLISSVFWLNILMGLTITLLIILTAPFIASLLNSAEVINILRVLSLSFLFSSFTIVQQALFEKELKFKCLGSIEIVAAVFGSVVGIILAFLNFGVWSLVFQTLIMTFINSILIWSNSSFRPIFKMQLSDIKIVSNFGLNLTGFNILNYFVRNADYVIIQKFLGEIQLGFYNLAYRIMLYPLQNITYILSRVMFPVFAKIQDDHGKFRKSYILLVSTIAFITFPLMMGLMAVSDIFVLVIFGEKWENSISVILILAPLGMIQSIYTPAGAIFQSKGRTDIWFKWGLFSGLVFVTAFVIGIKWGINGVATGYLIANLITIYPGLYIPFRLINLKVQTLVKSISKIFYFSLMMMIIVYITKTLSINHFSELLTLIISTLTGIIIYIILNLGFNRENTLYLKKILFDKTIS